MRKFKPKQSVLEMGIMKTMDYEKIGKFQGALSIQNEKREQKEERGKYMRKVQEKFER